MREVGKSVKRCSAYLINEIFGRKERESNAGENRIEDMVPRSLVLRVLVGVSEHCFEDLLLGSAVTHNRHET
jgi:hypothetical protein